MPDQHWTQFQMDLTTAATLGPEHLSCYALTLEPGTKLYETMHPRTDADEILLVRMFHLAHDFLMAICLDHYEISNYALPGRRCRHNFRYWQNLDYWDSDRGGRFLIAVEYKNVSEFFEYWKSLLTPRPSAIESEEHLAGS